MATINLRDFGAVGDGSDEGAKLRAAIAALANGDALFIPRPASTNGYCFTGTLSFRGKQDIAILGEGGPIASRLTYLGGGDAAAVSFVGSVGMHVRTVSFYARESASPPQTILALGRPAGDTGSYGNHMFHNVVVNGYADVALVYNVASEENVWLGGRQWLDGGNAKYVHFMSQMNDLNVGAGDPSFPGFQQGSVIATMIHGVRFVRRTPYVPESGHDDAAVIYIVARGATGDLSIRDCFGAVTGGAIVRFHVPDTVGPGHGPFIIDGVRTEGFHRGGLPDQKYGVYVGGVPGSVLVGLDVRRLTCGNLSSVGSYGIYGEDGVTLQDCSFYGTLPIQEGHPTDAIADSSIWRGRDVRVDEGRQTITFRESATYLEGGRRVYRATVPNHVFAVGWGEFAHLNIPFADARMGDFVRVSFDQQLLDGVHLGAQVWPAGNVRVQLQNLSLVTYSAQGTLRVEVIRAE